MKKLKFIFVNLLILLNFACTANSKEDFNLLQKIDQKFIQGDLVSSRQETEKYVQKYPQSFRGWNLLGWISIRENQLDKAQDYFNKAIHLNPKWDNAYTGLGTISRKQGDLKKAREFYLKSISLNPDNAEAYSSLLVIEVAEGNAQKAVEYGEKAWALRQNLPSIPANLAIAYHLLGNSAKRDHYYREAEALDYSNLPAVQDIFKGKKPSNSLNQ